MPEDKQAQQVIIHGGDSWLGQNLPQYDFLQSKLQELETRNDALPADFNPRVFLQFIRGSVNEIKRLTAMNHALTEALKDSNLEKEGMAGNDETQIAFEQGRLVEK